MKIPHKLTENITIDLAQVAFLRRWCSPHDSVFGLELILNCGKIREVAVAHNEEEFAIKLQAIEEKLGLGPTG